MVSDASKPLTEPDAAGWVAGVRAKGEFRCLECGYGVTVYRHLPECPMCHATAWERVPWRPYSRSFNSPSQG